MDGQRIHISDLHRISYPFRTLIYPNFRILHVPRNLTRVSLQWRYISVRETLKNSNCHPHRAKEVPIRLRISVGIFIAQQTTCLLQWQRDEMTCIALQAADLRIEVDSANSVPLDYAAASSGGTEWPIRILFFSLINKSGEAWHLANSFANQIPKPMSPSTTADRVTLIIIIVGVSSKG